MELTEAEMARDRRAEEIEQDMIEDFDEFSKWLKEEFSLTNQAIMVHAHIAAGEVMGAGMALHSMWNDYCKAKSYEKAGE